MNKTEILQELPKLTPDERQEVRQCLADLDQDDWLDDGTLTAAEKALIEERLRDLEARPHASIPWEQARTALLAPFSR
jgi:transcription elongation GreA/GreB family factor